MPLRLFGYVTVFLLAVMALTGCAGVTAPPKPSASELRSLISEAEGDGASGYNDFQVSFHRFISNSAWPAVMTSCVRTRGVTVVDFRLSNDPYWSPTAPQGVDAVKRALQACELQYPTITLETRLHTTAQWSYQYDYLVDDFVPCVRSTGAHITGLPTRDEFLAATARFDALPSPYSYVSTRRAAVPHSVLLAKCPALAPGL